MTDIRLTGSERLEIAQLLADLFGPNARLPTVELVQDSILISDQLPRRIRLAFNDFKRLERDSTLAIRGASLGEEALEPTPHHLPAKHEKEFCTRAEALHLIFSSRLGEVFTWSSIQSGNLINEVIPIREDADKVISSGSQLPLELHTEDAFHPLAGEYLGLLCLRNPGNNPLNIVDVADLQLHEDVRQVLFEPRFIIGVNLAHRARQVAQLSPIFFGDRANPYIRVNLNRIDTEQGDKVARNALATLTAELRAKSRPFGLAPGDFVYLDNFRLAHGRDRYDPKFDGSDRWLKRLYITNDLRRSRAWRSAASSRVIEVDRTQY